MKLFVTVLEATCEAATAAVRQLRADHDGVEIRAERFPSIDFAALRASTAKPLILTRRGLPFDGAVFDGAIAAGIDLVDVEYPAPPGLARRERVVLSHHDFDGMPDVEAILGEMRRSGCAQIKLAVMPRTFADNRRLIRLLESPGASRTTVIGMGEAGLYSRILAPFRGSALFFASPSEAASAAPGQISLDRALEIYGGDREGLRAERVFALVGNPVGHSLSPSIHNPLFRTKGVPAAYTLAAVQSFDEIAGAFAGGEPCGLSVTAPFKEQAYAFAVREGAEVGQNARECGAVNTLVRRRTILADNTDVDGFASLLAGVCGGGGDVAVAGAGGTARAALVALRGAGLRGTLFSRTESRGRELALRFGMRAEPLASLAGFKGNVVIDTTPAGTELPLPPQRPLTVIESAYGAATAARRARLERAGVRVVDGLALLRAQAVRQHELFMKVFE